MDSDLWFFAAVTIKAAACSFSGLLLIKTVEQSDEASSGLHTNAFAVSTLTLWSVFDGNKKKLPDRPGKKGFSAFIH